MVEVGCPPAEYAHTPWRGLLSFRSSFTFAQIRESSSGLGRSIFLTSGANWAKGNVGLRGLNSPLQSSYPASPPAIWFRVCGVSPLGQDLPFVAFRKVHSL